MTLKILSIFLVSVLLLVVPVAAENDITIIATSFPGEQLDITDNTIDTSWDDTEYFLQPEEYGTDSFIKMAVNESYLFTLLKVSSSKEWVALEFGAYEEFCMVNGNDGWTFYIDDTTEQVTGYDELYTGSLGPPDHDTVDHLRFESVKQGDYYYIEILRLLDTGDIQDLQFADGDLWNVKFASSTHHAKGGIDNPTEFGPSQIYYISVQMGDDIQVPVVPNRIDYDFYKFIIFIGIFLSAGIFIISHILVRQVFRPLSHPIPIVDNSFKRPDIKSRWEETFGPVGSKDTRTKDTHKEAKA